MDRPEAAPTPISVPAASLAPFERISLFNSPYPAHTRGCAIDLYPDADGASNGGPEPHSGPARDAPTPDRVRDAPSPVSGVVREVRTVDAPPRPDADGREFLLLVDVTGPGDPADPAAPAGTVARILHVEPAVEIGDRVAVGDSLGRTVRSGFFAPWVANHVHLGFRRPDQHLRRARGSLPLTLGVDVAPLDWDGTGIVAEAGDTYIVLDSPAGRSAGGFLALGSDDGTALDGGLVHYAGGGTLSPSGTAAVDADDSGPRSLSLFDERVGVARGRNVEWADLAVLANGERVTGLSLFAARDHPGVKLVCPDHDFAVGDPVRVSLGPTDAPTRLGE